MMSMLRRVDWQIVLPVVTLLVISLTTLFSINPVFFRNQFFFALVSGLLFFLLSQVDILQLAYYKKQIYLISLGLLFLLLLIGFSSHGAVRWLGFFGLGIQFSELLKPFLLIAFASYLSTRRDISFVTFLKVVIFLGPVAFLIYKQPDLGSALIYIMTVFLTLIFYGFPLWWFGVGLLGVVGSLPILWQFLHEYQRQRLLTFFHLTNDPLGTSYNAIQAIISVGSGMFFGEGLGQGTQSVLKFLPEKQTDFIFATLSEDLGFVGAAIVILAFLFLLYRLFIIFTQVDDMFCKVIIASAFSLILIQFFVNIGMNIGIIPIVGVPLPFVSYGGSSLLSNAIILGIVSQIATRTKRKHVLEIT